ATAGRICAITNGPAISPYTFNYRHVVDGLWYPGTATSSCAASLRWFRDGLGGQPFEELLKEAAEVKTGSEGLIFHPYLQGELTPYNDATLRASFVGISSRHNRGHFARAVLEGVAFSMKDCGNVINELGLNTGRIRLLGGGSSSSLWAQIVSDVFGKPMEKTERDDSSLGSAILAGVASGIFGSFEEGV
ncbi:carbohydrate kinase, FGGY family protein, partial [Fusobacterium sp. CM21]